MATIDSFNFDGPASIVEDKYERSIELAEEALGRVDEFVAKLTDGFYQPPTVSVQWQSIAAPTLPELPTTPTLPSVEFVEPTGKPTPFTESLGSVAIDDMTLEMPDLNFGVAPTLNIGQAPALPEVREVAVPDAPEVVLPDIPTFLALQTHTFGGINLREEWLDKLDDIPELSILQPAPFSFTPNARYASQLLDNLKARLNERIQGGTGLTAADEAAIFGRALDRETKVALAREQEVMRAAEAMGFPLPSGALAGQLADARREYHEKLSGLSRDIAIKQAELAQANMQQATDLALRLEGTLLEDAYKMEVLAIDAAKAVAQNAIDVHNAAVEHYKALLAGYQAYANAYDTVIKAELNKVEVFKALLSAEQTKADINKSLVDRYKAEIEGRMAAVEIYKARVSAAQTLVELERTRIQAGAEQVRAFVATVNAETAKADLYKATISAEGTKAEAFGALTRAYGSKVGAQAEKARAEVAKFQALISAKGLEWDGWKAQVAAQTAKVDAAARQSNIMMDGYRVASAALESKAGMFTRLWESKIKEYEAGMNITFQAAKQNAEAVMHAGDARLDANKVALAAMSQQVASAWTAVSASAQISGSANMSITQSV